MSAQKLPVAALYVSKIKPQAVRNTIHTLIHAGSVVPAEIGLDVGHDVIASEIVFNLQVDAGELRRRAEFSVTSWSSIAERYAGEIGGDITLRVCGSKYILEINESSGGQNSIAEFEGPYRSLLFTLLRLLISRSAHRVSNAIVDVRRKV